MRKLTGSWYLKKRYFGGYKVMVQIEYTTTCEFDLTESPVFVRYVDATDEDILELGIKVI